MKVGMLMGTLMETIEKKFEEEKKKQASLAVAPKLKSGPTSSMSLL